MSWRWSRWPVILAVSVAATGACPAAASPVDDYERSWVHRALGLQYELAGDVALVNSPFIGTHDSYNSVAELGASFSAEGPSQRLTMVDQLRLDTRSLELDVHTFLDFQNGGYGPVVCRGAGAAQGHAGCGVQRSLAPILDPIAAWLRAHPDQVLLLYIQDEMAGEAGHDEGAAVIEDKLGGMLYRPPGRGARCAALPLDVSRDDVRAAGAQVILMSGCGAGAAWRRVAFDGSAREERRPRGYTDFPACGGDFDRAQYESKLIRYYEDESPASSGAGADAPDPITAVTAGRMARCGVDLLGLDQLRADDRRLEALVWSWAPDEPREGGGRRCALQRADGRWVAATCRARHPVACRSREGGWWVSRKMASPPRAERVCRRKGMTHAAPRTGFEAQLLGLALQSRGRGDALLGLRQRRGSWIALDRR